MHLAKTIEDDLAEGSFEQHLLNHVLRSSLALEELRELIANNASVLNDETTRMDGALQQSSEAVSFLDRLNDAVNLMASDTNAANTSAQECVQLSTNISELADLINRISMQTNIISLNASVEAARAGAAGKGFSVIAQEVRELALSAKQASASISEFAQEISAGVGRVEGSVDAVHAKLGELSTSAELLNQSMRSSLETSESMVGIIRKTASQTFIRTVKMDHIVWKNAVYRVINSMSDASIASFADHKSCRLGKWYLSEGKSLFGNLDIFRQLDKPHEQVHQNGIAALTANERGEGDLCIDYLRNMEEASDQVMDYLGQLEVAMLSAAGYR